MNSGSDNLLVATEETLDKGRDEKAELNTALVELGKVSDTRGGWLGAKIDSGAGLIIY